jgi:hypothetical protein
MSNTQEKAKEIYCKYADALNIRDLQTTANPFAKQCALIAVDEILNIEHPQIIIYTEIIKNSIRDYFQDEYWNEVKKEIQKL